MAFLVATTSLPAVYRPNDDHWNAARSWQNNDVYGGLLPVGRLNANWLERRTLVPITCLSLKIKKILSSSVQAPTQQDWLR